jgi:hypothetical protein
MRPVMEVAEAIADVDCSVMQRAVVRDGVVMHDELEMQDELSIDGWLRQRAVKTLNVSSCLLQMLHASLCFALRISQRLRES